MSIITQSQRYLPHELKTRFYACELYRNTGCPIDFVTRRYHISKASLMRWNKRYDGSKESLADQSHRPYTPHPNCHTEEELTWIRNYLRRSPHLTMIELYGKLRLERGYTRHPASLFRILRKLGYYKPCDKPKEAYKPKKYDTPTDLGIKWQCDVKYVPEHCKASSLYEDESFFQYTMIEEASRERFLYAYDEHSAQNAADFLLRATLYFGYSPHIVQTDNGHEFTHPRPSPKPHDFDLMCETIHATHQLIRPRTPRHNGKVERSHRNDNKRFYAYLKFYSLDDLRLQMKRYLYRSNRIPMATLNYLTPIEKRAQLFHTLSK